MNELEPRTIGSVAQFRSTLAEVVAAYLRQFEPTVDPELVTVRLEATAPDLSIVFAQHGGEPASLTVSMSKVGAEPEQRRRR